MTAPPGRAGLCAAPTTSTTPPSRAGLMVCLHNPALPGGANSLEQPREKKPLPPFSCHSSYSPRPVDLEYM